ncbi:MAG: NAD-dependent epimerase/dehydratase family protein [Anaerolineales bacterium]
MRILITGSEGNIGVHLVRQLRAEGHEVLRADLLPGWHDEYIQTNIVFPNDLLPAFQRFQPEVVFHLAAMVSRVTCEGSPHMAVDTNLSGTNNIAQMCKNFGAKLIFFSTSEVYGNLSGEMREDMRDLQPTNRYGLTKYMGEMLLDYEHREYGLDVVVLRPFMFYHEDETRGSHRSAMIRFAENLSQRERITVHKDSRRGWLHMDDAVRAIAACVHLSGWHIINIGHPDIIETEWMARYMGELLEINVEDYWDLIPLPERMTLEKYPNLDRQRELLNFTPEVDIKMGIQRVLRQFAPLKTS